MRAALQDPLVRDEQVTTAASVLRTQSEVVEKQCGRSYLLFLAFAAGFSLLAEDATQTLSLFGVPVSSRSGAVLILPVLAAYCAYRAVAAAVLSQVLTGAIGAYWSLKLGPFVRHRVTDLFSSPTPYVTEATLTNLTTGLMKKLTTAWLFTVSAVLCLGPFAWFLIASKWIWTQESHLPVCAVALVIVWLFASRGCLLIVQFFIIIYQDVIGELKATDPAAAKLVDEVEADFRQVLNRRGQL